MIKEKWKAIYAAYSNGCSSSPDFNFQECCDRHDYHYATHNELVESDIGQVSTKPITRARADSLLLKCIKEKWMGFFLPYIYYLTVRTFGGKNWKLED